MRFTASAFLGLALLLYGDVSWGEGPGQTLVPPPKELTLEEQAKQAKEAEEANEAERTKRAEAWSQFFFEEVLLRSCDDPTLRSAIALPQPKLIVDATDDGKVKLTGRAGIKLKKYFVFDVEVVSPRSSPDEEETTLASLDGLSDGSTAELKLSWFGWKLKKTETEIAQIIRNWDQEKASKENGSASTENTNSAKDTDSAQENMKAIVGPPISQQNIESYMESTLSNPSDLGMTGSKEYQTAAKTYRTWLKEKHPYIPVGTLKVNFEQNKFRFFTPTDGPPAGLKEAFESHTNYQLVGSLGSYVKGRTYLAANYRYGRKYMDGATEEFCTPMGAARILNCVDHVITPPEKGKSETLEFEARGLMVGDFGIGAFVTRDLRANVTRIEIPVYRLQKLGASRMELNLGARAQWSSDTREFAFSVFAGPALSTVFRMLNR